MKVSRFARDNSDAGQAKGLVRRVDEERTDATGKRTTYGKVGNKVKTVFVEMKNPAQLLPVATRRSPDRRGSLQRTI